MIRERFKYLKIKGICMGKHHHILIWLVIIYLLLGIITYFLVGSNSYLDIVIWPRYISSMLSNLGIGG
jgi:hypothetical protein